MSLFMIEWNSIDPKISSSMFMSGAFPLPQPLKLVSSVHRVDKAAGYMIVEGAPDDFYAAILALPPNVLDIEVYPVVDDHGAKKGLENRNSAYKVK